MDYVALLRGVNVGPSRRVSMEALRRALAGLGLARVRTLLQSGNALFASDEPEAALVPRIEAALAAAFGFPVPVVLRTAAEIAAALADVPFTREEIDAAEAAASGISYYVGFLGAPPTDADRAVLAAAAEGSGDRFAVVGRDLHLLFRDTIRTSKLATRFDRLSSPATTRSGGTVARFAAAFEERT